MKKYFWQIDDEGFEEGGVYRVTFAARWPRVFI